MRRIAALSVLVLLIAGAATAAPPQPAPGDAEGLLAAAELYAAAGDVERARTFLETALQAAPNDPGSRKRAAAVLSRLQVGEQKKLQASQQTAEARQRAVLAEARRLAAAGRTEEARELLAGKLETFAPPLLAEAERELEALHSGWLYARWASLLRQEWLFDTALVLLLLWLLFRTYRWYCGLRYRNHWLVTSADDPTGLGLGLLASERLWRWSEEQAGASAGLLKLEAMRVQALPRLSQDRPELSFSTALAQFPTLGQVNLSAIGSALESVRRWGQGYRPTITVTVHVVEQQVVVRLTQRTPAGRIYTVSASGTRSLEGSALAVDSASFKMYYLLANKASLKDAESADQLRSGLDHLHRHIVLRDPDALRLAYDVFRAVRAQNPGFQEAQLYEGIALDLMERHEDAERVFRYLAEHGDQDIREKALYNLGVSQFREYTAKDLEDAIGTLERLLGNEILADLAASPPRTERLAASPIRAMAAAARANAIAHKPIFWQGHTFGDRVKDPEKVLERKLNAKDTVDGWLKKVQGIADLLLELSGRPLTPRNGWDDMTVKQLRWAAHNAKGNVYLNVGMRFLEGPPLPAIDEPGLRKGYIEKAHEEFRECEALLPAGVETLSNLATALLDLSRTAEARDYAQQAIEVNPDYEYAYYRLAQAWERDNQTGKVVETLRRFQARKSPEIPGFKKLFETYRYEIASP